MIGSKPGSTPITGNMNVFKNTVAAGNQTCKKIGGAGLFQGGNTVSGTNTCVGSFGTIIP